MGALVEPSALRSVDPTTGGAVTGAPLEPENGALVEPLSGASIDPTTGAPVTGAPV
jgi:hypothetical protein